MSQLPITTNWTPDQQKNAQDLIDRLRKGGGAMANQIKLKTNVIAEIVPEGGFTHTPGDFGDPEAPHTAQYSLVGPDMVTVMDTMFLTDAGVYDKAGLSAAGIDGKYQILRLNYCPRCAAPTINDTGNFNLLPCPAVSVAAEKTKKYKQAAEKMQVKAAAYEEVLPPTVTLWNFRSPVTLGKK
jgi:hypothetical protein